jgi:hypothetical protein
MQRLNLGPRHLDLRVGDVESRLCRLVVVAVLGVCAHGRVAQRAELLLERRHALARGGCLRPRRRDGIVHRRRCQLALILALVEGLLQHGDLRLRVRELLIDRGDLATARVRACLCDLGGGAHLLELGGAVGQLSLECRLRVGRLVGRSPDLCLERAGGGGRGARATLGLVTVAERLVTVGQRRIALGPRLVALGPQMRDVGLGRRAALALALQSPLQLGERQAP